MKRSLKDIPVVPSSHNVGKKHVLLASNESGCPITQIAITDLMAGEVVEAHIHQDMQEGFFVVSGMLDIIMDGAVEHCCTDDFLWINCGTCHELRAVSDVRIMTVGCEV